MKWYRWIVIAGILTAVVLVIGYGFMPRPVLVEVAPVVRGPLRVSVEEEGRTRVKDRYVLSAPVAAVLCRIELEVGDPVQKGQVVAALEPLRSDVLDPRSRARAEARIAASRASLQLAQENVEAAVAEAEFAAAELKRIRPLRQRGMVSQEALERTETELRRAQAMRRSAEFAVEVARFELQAARTALDYSAAQEAGEAPEKILLNAPVTGQVLKIHQESECVVNPGQPLLEIGDPRGLEVEVDVLSADAVRIQPGTRVLFERWGGSDPLEGRVWVVEPVGFTKVSALGVEEQRVWVIADFTSPRDRWERLGDGYRVEARFILWEDENVLQIPTSALFRHANGWAVFVVESDEARLRRVELGRRSGLTAQIVAGLQDQEKVITHPGDAVEDGVRVQVR